MVLGLTTKLPCRQGLPSSEEANLLIIHKRAGPLVSKFRSIFDHITPDRWLWPNGVRAHLHACTDLLYHADQGWSTACDAPDSLCSTDSGRMLALAPRRNPAIDPR